MEIIETINAPGAIGPYSQAVKCNGFIFCSGQIPLSAGGMLVEGGALEQTRQVMENLKVVLEAGGASMGKIIKTTIYLSNMDDFAAVNAVYESYFEGIMKPARATVEVSRLPRDVAVEIDCVAAV